jgi:outer membrane protein OmpA-like peptidoglycan-associated protein
MGWVGVAQAVPITGTVQEAVTNKSLSGFIVSFAGATPAQEGVVADDGSFVIDVPSQATKLRILSSTRVLFEEHTASGGTANILIKPTGYVYDSSTGKPVSGITVQLYYTSGTQVTTNLGLKQVDQVTDKHGLYHFDFNTNLKVRIVLVTPGQYQFPSNVHGPEAACPNDPVHPSEVPIVGDPTPYCLEFTAQPIPKLPSHNHIPIDGSGTSIPVQTGMILAHTASKSEVAGGDIVTYTIRATNNTGKDLVSSQPGGGVWMRTTLSSGLRLIESTVQASVDGKPTLLATTQGPSLLRFQPKGQGTSGGGMFDVPSGSTVLVRYQVVVDAQARSDGLLSSRTQVMDPGGVGVSQVAKVDLRVSRDPIFDRSWVRGRVFCDEDGDGWADENEPGVYGAKVYIDTGRYATTDPKGHYHLSDVAPGLHLVKIDENTVPPGSLAVSSISRSLHVSPGIPQKVSFGFRCNTEHAGPSVVQSGDDDEDIELPDVVVLTGNLKSMDVLVDGQRSVAKGTIGLTVDGDPEGDAVFDARWTPRGPDAPVVFSITVPKGTQQSRLWIETQGKSDRWQAIRIIDQLREPFPKRIRWNRMDSQGRRADTLGGLYRVRVEAVDDAGGRWRAPPVYFTVGAKRSLSVFRSSIGGSPLRGSATLNRSAKKVINQVSAKMKDMAQAQALVVVGVRDNLTPKERANYQQWGDIVAQALAAKARVGLERIGVRLEAGSAGVSIDLFDHARPNRSPLVLPNSDKMGANVRVNGKLITTDKKGRYVAVIDKNSAGHVVVELRDEAGVVREVLVEISEVDGGTKARLVHANLQKGSLTIGGNAVNLVPLSLRINTPFQQLRMTKGTPQESINFQVSIPDGVVKAWTLVVTGPDDKEVLRSTGESDPPGQIPWEPTGELREGKYRYRLEATTQSDGALTSNQGSFELVEGSVSREEGTLIQTITGRLFGKQQILRSRLQRQMKTLAAALSKRSSTDRFLIEVHADGRGESEAAKSTTSIEATRLRNVLIMTGLNEARVDARGVGNDRPVSGGKGSSSRKKNRRIEVRVLPSPSGATPDESWSIRIDDKPMKLSKSGLGVSRLGGELGGQSTVEIVGPTGSRLLEKVVIGGDEPEVEDEPEPPFGIRVLNRSLAHRAETGKPAPPLPISALQVSLPPNGAELGQPVLPIQGKAPAVEGVEITINGRVVPVKNGTFQLLLRLPSGKESSVVIQARDPAGNVARVERSYRVKGNALFLLALADGALTQSTTKLDGVREDTSIRFNDVPVVNDLFLHGRGVLYLKARIQGNELLKTVRITAYADSARQRDSSAFVEQVVDPKRFYPVYGDASIETSDVHTRGKYFVAIEADPGKMVVGSFRAGMWGVELLRYGRVLEGAQLKLKKAFVPGYETVIQGFVSYEDRLMQHAQATLKGTGGSYYFLPHRDIIEGSEQVRIVIYDRDTGGVLQEIAQVPDLDYRMDNLQGRLTFRKPVPSQANSSFLMGAADALNGHLALEGHPVHIQVSYETRDPGDPGATSWGVRGSQTFNDMVRVGGGYIREGHGADGSPDYELWGTDLRVKLGRSTQIEAEVAHSRSTSGSQHLSLDGGLSYDRLGPIDGGSKKGWGIGVRARSEVGEWLGREEPFITLGAQYRRQDAGFVSNHAGLERGMERGGGQAHWHINRNQGLVVRHDTLTADSIDRGFVTTSGSFTRMISSVQYKHRVGSLTWFGEALHGYEDHDEDVGYSGHRGALSALVRYRLSPRWTLFFEQQGHLGGDERIFRSATDRLVTGVGVDLAVASDLWLSLSERIRWSGEDMAAIGVRTRLSDKAEMYVEQRLHSPRNDEGRAPEFVIGSEERWGPNDEGRSYGEFQTGSASSAAYTRAVVGLGRTYQITRGLTADMGYERSHQTRVGGNGSSGDTNTLSVGVAYLGNANLSMTSRFETRYDQGNIDRLQLVSLNRVRARLSPTMELIGRANIGVTQNLDMDKREAETVELNLGLSYRPMSDAFSLVVKAARITDMRPVNLDADVGSVRTTSDVVAIEPIIETPWGLQVTPKIAYRHSLEESENMADLRNHTILTALRLALHLWQTLDLAAEYRWMFINLAEQMKHGALVEIAAHITRYARIGVGYNFSHMEDDLFQPMSGNNHGFFVRLTGMY